MNDYLFLILEKLENMGLSNIVLREYHRKGLIKKLEEIDEKIKSYELKERDVKGEVLIPYVHSQGDTDYLLAFLGHVLRTRGYQPLFVSCRGNLSNCLSKIDRPDRRGTCIACKFRSDSIIDEYGFEKIPISDYADPTIEVGIYGGIKEIQQKSHHGVNIGKYAVATTRRHLRKYTIDLKSDDDVRILKKYVNSAAYLADFTRSIIENRDIIATVGNHPAYVYSGVLLEATKEYGLPAISYGGGYFRKDAFLFGNILNRQGFEQFSDHDTLLERVNANLTEEEVSHVDFYMSGRKKGNTIRNSKNYIKGANKTISSDKYNNYVCLFANLLWDGSLSGASVTFDDPFDWIKYTIQEFGYLNDSLLVVKPHPAEAYRETRTHVAEWVKRNVEIPENVILLSEDTDVSPYSLIDEINAAIVYNSTVGMEAAYHGVPVITVGDTHYKNLGFTYDPKDPKSYSHLLKNIEDLSLSIDQIKRAKRYAYFLLVERHVTIDNLDSVSSIHKIDHDTISNSVVMDRVVEQIISNERSISSSANTASYRLVDG